VPALTPVIVVPETETNVLELLHVPPETVLDKLIVLPIQTLFGPLIVPALGNAFTVTVVV
jgi:hypothetical protein